jgi:hypothetical protein
LSGILLNLFLSNNRTGGQNARHGTKSDHDANNDDHLPLESSGRKNGGLEQNTKSWQIT